MAGTAEWNNLAAKHKGLRVTKPVGAQRDTYFLQLPYRWALPLLITSSGLHWLMSQSIFLVRIDQYDRDGKLKTTLGGAKSACGFSGFSWAMFTTCFWILCGIVALVGRKRIKMKVPYAANCSLVISSACHTPVTEKGAQSKALRWGVVRDKMFDGQLHCSFSSETVKSPKEGERYL